MQVLGAVGNDDLPSLVAAADVFVFPSTKEGFGLAAMEALAAGVPVVARELPVLREVFGSAVTFAADPTQLAEQLLAARSHMPEREAAGRELAAGYTWTAAAQAHARRYAEVLGRAALNAPRPAAPRR